MDGWVDFIRQNQKLMNESLVKINITVAAITFYKKSYLQIENTDFCLVLQQVSSHISLAKLILS